MSDKALGQFIEAICDLIKDPKKAETLSSTVKTVNEAHENLKKRKLEVNELLSQHEKQKAENLKILTEANSVKENNRITKASIEADKAKIAELAKNQTNVGAELTKKAFDLHTKEAFLIDQSKKQDDRELKLNKQEEILLERERIIKEKESRIRQVQQLVS